MTFTCAEYQENLKVSAANDTNAAKDMKALEVNHYLLVFQSIDN